MNHIYFAGYSAVHPADFVFEVPEGYDCYLLLITSTPARFRVNDQIVAYPAHQAVLYPPHHKIWYAADAEAYENDFIRFASDEPFVRNFPFTGRPFPLSDPAYCHSLIQLLTWETAQWLEIYRSSRCSGTDMLPGCDKPSDYYSTDSESGQIISRLLHILFLKLQSDIKHHAPIPHDHELLTLRRQIINDPQLDWNVAKMADQLHMSTGHLHLLYKQKFGLSCMDDVIASRIRKAKDLLIYTDHSIVEICEQCGYQNLEHFCRQFRKHTGMTPGSFRKNSGS